MHRTNTSLLAMVAGLTAACVTAIPFDAEMQARLQQPRGRHKRRARTFYAGTGNGRGGSVQNADYLKGAWQGDGVQPVVTREMERKTARRMAKADRRK